jgi:hypothetical protein
LLFDTKVNADFLGKDIDSTIDLTAISDSGLVIGYGRTFSDHWHWGFNTKVLFRAGGTKSVSVLDLAQGNGLSLSPTKLGGAGIGMDLDTGLTYDVVGLPWGVLNQFSIVTNNLLASQFSMVQFDGSLPGLPRLLSFGFHSVLPGKGSLNNLHLALDFAEFQIGGESDPDRGARTGSFWKHVNWGVEAPFESGLVLRGGFHQGGLSLGVGYRSHLFKVDFATYTEELASGVGRLSSRRYAITFAIGNGSPAPAPIFSRDAQFKASLFEDDEERMRKLELQRREMKKVIPEDDNMTEIDLLLKGK